ncbi:MAG TPA: hypothetical protein VK914_07205 [bacterium]|jgi:hypothetical protein|nr:hypothetical protein [bacterium]
MNRPVPRFALLCALLSLPLGAFALDSPVSQAEAPVLLQPSAPIPAEGGPGAKIAYLPSGPALLSGGVGFISVGNGLGLGLGGYSLSSEYVPTHDGIKYDLGYSYGGVVANYSLYFPRSLFSIHTSVMVGPGQGWAVPRLTGADRVYVNFIQIEPGIDIMLNVSRQLSLGLGFSWRLCGGADLDNLLGSDLGGGGISFLILVGQN